jgi:lycopene beta-cyclase
VDVGCDVDVAIVGAGLSGALVALALARFCPHLRVAIIERAPQAGGNHTWSFHGSDLAGSRIEDAWPLVDPLVVYRWSEHEVRFPQFSRRMSGDYHAVTADRLREVLDRMVKERGHAMFLGTGVRHVEAGRVDLDDGRVVKAGLVVDARGAGPPPVEGSGFQKFIGWEIERSAHCADFPALPVIMDATVAQADGYRFVYVLPFSRRHALVEDTYFSRSPDIDGGAVRARLQDYLSAQGWSRARVVREEVGVLPMPWKSGVPVRQHPWEGLVVVGYAAGFFNAATGYSLPWAVDVALAIAQAGQNRARLAQALADLEDRRRGQDRFFRLLNQLAFCGVGDDARRGVFARFYRLPEPLIRRFYASSTTMLDRARVLGGRPPAGFSLGALFAARGLASPGDPEITKEVS